MSQNTRFCTNVYLINRKFKSGGTEGMLDVVLSCTLIFMLMSALVQIESLTFLVIVFCNVKMSSIYWLKAMKMYMRIH